MQKILNQNGLAPLSSIRAPLTPVVPAAPLQQRVLPQNALNITVRSSHVTAGIAHASMPAHNSDHS